MNYQELIKLMKNANRSDDTLAILPQSDVSKAIISALQEVEKYHKTGLTPKQVAENISELNATKRILGHYQQLGTLEEVREVVEKQHPKTPTWDGDGYAPDGTFVWDEWKCPRCGTRYEVEYGDYDYCPNCGQRIYLHADWSEEDD